MHQGRTTEKLPADTPSPKWWGGAIAGIAGVGFVALMAGAFTGQALPVLGGLVACGAALMMAMRWR